MNGDGELSYNELLHAMQMANEPQQKAEGQGQEERLTPAQSAQSVRSPAAVNRGEAAALLRIAH